MDNANKNKVRVRLAPSPTGPLHIGTARTALSNYLFAKKNGGTFILRIDDTDTERSQKKFEDDVINHLKWLGIIWDEGPGIDGGPHEPYYQSKRTALYRTHLEKLIKEKKAYYCFCGKDTQDKPDGSATTDFANKYPGTCRSLSEEEVKNRHAAGERSVIRFLVSGEKVFFEDMVRGHIDFDTSLFGDVVIAKSLDAPLYNFATVIDDYEMDITHVIRGEDHISNTPKQLLIAKALGFAVPVFGHLPLLLGTDRSKLSKRNAVVSIADYKEDGFLPEALVNFIALLGWNPGDARELFSLQELISEFSVSKIQKSGAVFDIKKLEWMNGHYIKALFPDVLREQALYYLEKNGVLKREGASYRGASGSLYDEAYVNKALALEQSRLKKMSEVVEVSKPLFVDIPEYQPPLLLWKQWTQNDIVRSLNAAKEHVLTLSDELFTNEYLKENLLQKAKSIQAKDAGYFLWPLRVALSGRDKSPSPAELMVVLGKKRTLERIQAAINKIS